MNFLLSLNKKYILIFSIILFLITLLFFSINYIYSLEDKLVDNFNIIPNADITEPRFAINNENEKIFVTAKLGNFINDDKILLEKNVLFKSKNFSIKTETVIFDRNQQTASSNSKSIFNSKNTKISSEGFNIYDNGKKIKFLGKAIVLLK